MYGEIKSALCDIVSAVTILVETSWSHTRYAVEKTVLDRRVKL